MRGVAIGRSTAGSAQARTNRFAYTFVAMYINCRKIAPRRCLVAWPDRGPQAIELVVEFADEG
jgi:hypothetical protein